MIRLDYNINWSEHFQLSEDSPSGLIEVRGGRNVGNKQFNKNGDPKAWKLGFKYKDYCVHRIIWVLTYGSIDPNLVIDHVDGNPFNNKISNLSLKSVADNSRNQHKFRSNTTGVTGVTLSKNSRGRYNYIAHWQGYDGKRKLKYFSVEKYGEKEAKILAIAYRERQIELLISEGANYTERHGIISKIKTNVEKQGVVRDTQVYLLCNKWHCKDGTVLQSRHQHDCVSHTSDDGEYSFCDGGAGGYIRHSGNMTPLLVYSNDPHELIRDNFEWTSYGINGDEPAKRQLLKELTVDHMNAILRTQKHLPEYILDLFKNEIQYRNTQGGIL